MKVAEAAALTATAQVEQAVAVERRTEAEFERWKSEYGRVAELGASSAVPQKLVDETKNQLRAADAARGESAAKTQAAKAALVETQARIDNARADEAAAKADEQVAAADYRRAEALVGYATIRAPFDGVVSVRNIEIGHFVQPTAAGDNHPLLTVVHADALRIFVDVPEGDAGYANAGDEAIIRVQALDDAEFRGQVTRTSWALDKATRTLRREIDIPNPDGKLRPAMYAYATIVLAEQSDALVVPRSAIVRSEQGAYCGVVRDGKIVHMPVSLGLVAGNEVEILAGLTGDDTIVLMEAASLPAGQAVSVAAPAKSP